LRGLQKGGVACKGGAKHLKVIGRWGVSAVKTLTFEKWEGCLIPPQAPMVVPPLVEWRDRYFMATLKKEARFFIYRLS